MAADLVILQTPVNWFSAPWIYKKYVDEVFNVGLANKAMLEGDGRTREDLSKQYGTGGKMGSVAKIAIRLIYLSHAFSNCVVRPIDES